MPRPAHFSIDLPSPKHFDDDSDDGARDSGLGSDLELDELHSFNVIPSGVQTPRRSNVPASWKTMPHKGQLTILSLSRFADFFQMACLQAIMFHQLRSYDLKASDATIGWQAGLLQGSFTATQSVSLILWGKVADAKWGGRKRVLLVGFVGTGISCMGMAFSQSFAAAVLWRLLAGCLNGTVGAARIMVAETVERKFHSRAFMVLPLAFNSANILGPLLGELLVDPINNLSSLFGEKSLIGGTHGVSWMKNYPYALPNLLSAVILLTQAAVIYLGLVETSASRRYARDVGVEFANRMKRKMPFVRRKRVHYTRLSVNDATLFDATASPTGDSFPKLSPIHHQQILPLKRILTPNVIFTTLATSFVHFHLGAFATLWPTFLSTTHAAEQPNLHLPFAFTGGLSFAPTTVGLAMSTLGLIGIVLQLGLFSPVENRLGALSSFRYAILMFPLAYAITPYLALIPPTYSIQLWLVIGTLLLIHVTGQTFALPASVILADNCSPHPSVLGTVHGIAQSTAAASKTMGSFLGGTWYAMGLEKGTVGLAWWIVAVIAVLGCVASYWVKDGSGHEILLQGENGTEYDRGRVTGE